MKFNTINTILFLLCILTGCSTKQVTAPISVVWEMGENKQGYYENTFYITNTGKKTLDSNWVLYFCQLPAIPQPDENAPFVVEEISSTYYKLYPSEHYQPIPAGETVAFVFCCEGGIIKETNAPAGGFWLALDPSGKAVSQPLDVAIQVTPFTHAYQWTRPETAELPYPSGELVYEQNLPFQKIVTLKPTDIFPSVKSVNLTEGTFHFTPNVRIESEKGLENEANLLKEKLQTLFDCTVSDAGETVIFLKTLQSPFLVLKDEYQIHITKQQIEIEGISPQAVFYGTQTLLAILGNLNALPCELSAMNIKDYPDLEYRGQMLDVARNFTKKENVLKLIDLLSSYKMNVLHLHLGDDEGWRLEIPGLEELTTVGARRGYTIDEADCMYPQYGGGWNSSDANNLGNGYYSRQDFIEILKYAAQQHIRVIPEFDLPGHSRAAIKAMNARYNKYKATDLQKAEEYLLTSGDTSKYFSAQFFTDNVIDVALPSTYRFVYKVIDEVASTYQEAGLPLPSLHLGGDEVPHGAWEGSPACQALMQKEGWTEIRELKDYFIEQVLTHLQEKNIQFAAWQEVALLPDQTVNKKFADSNILSYCWNTVPEWGGDDVPYKLANAGYPIILCNVSNLYLDMAYNKHPQEPGLYWGGFVNEYTTHDMLPYDIYQSLRYNRKGEPVDTKAYAKTKLPLTKGAEVQIKGIQGQLWAETIRNFGMVERCLFPKIFGVVERAWNTQPAWATNESLYSNALVHYNAKIVQHELPRLHKQNVNFHVAQPGIKVIDGKLYANSTIPSARIYYTTDGSEPTPNSPLWTSPVACDASVVKAKAYYEGRESVTTVLK
ncbi:beta-N-acetylhexosaminidase [Bacteroidia bacterium]|nr:beta-N-acetylhexosaminidase [Bacteroidia bacterium]